MGKLGAVAAGVARMEASELRTLLEELAPVELRRPTARRILQDLRAVRLVAPRVPEYVARIPRLLERLPKLAEQLQFRRVDFAHVLLAGVNEDPAAKALSLVKQEYLRGCDELRAFARDKDFRRALSEMGTSTRVEVEQFASSQLQNLSGIVDRYGDLYRESYAVNALTRNLYPGMTNITSESNFLFHALRVDAQHIVEKRVLKVWPEDWALLGWEIEADMPAMAIMGEWHIPAPKNLEGLGGVVLNDGTPIEDVFSLTKEMEDRLRLKNFETADQYLAALRTFYGFQVTNKRGAVVEPLKHLAGFVDHVQKELDRARTNVALVKAVKKLRAK